MSERNVPTSPAKPFSTSEHIDPLNRAAMWVAGTSVPTTCIASGMLPMGM